MPYGDPYSNINSIVGQGYAQDASIRGQGIDQASALTQHFIDAFTRAQEVAYQRKMQESQIMHQRAQEAATVARQQALDSNNLYDDWSKTGQEANVPAFEQRAKLLGVPSPVPEQQFHPAVPAFTGGSDQALAPENNPTVQVGSRFEGDNPEQVQLMPQNTGGMEKSPIPRAGSIFTQMQKKQDDAHAVAMMNAEAKQTMADLASESQPEKIKLLQGQLAKINSSIANAEATGNYRQELLKVQQGKLAVSQGRLDLGNRIEGRQVGQTAIKNNAAVATGDANLDKTNTAFDNIINNANEIINHPKLSHAVGLFGSLPNVPGGPGADVSALIDTLGNKVTVDLIGELKSLSQNGSTGFGQLSEKEGATLRGMIGSLDRKQSPEQFKAQLRQVIQYAQAAKDRIRAKYDADIGSGLYQNRGMAPSGSIPPELQGAPQNIIDTYNRGGIVEGPNGQRFSKGR